MKQFVEKILANKVLVFLVLLMVLLHTIYKDARSSLPMPDDLRNRIVGSRVLADGGSPYYYNWQQGDSMRYYDTPNHTDQVVSSATSTPFFHWVMGTVSNLGQSEMNLFWFMLTYIALAICCGFALLAMPPSGRNKLYLIIVTALLFTYTAGWRFHINVGQNYIFVPAIALGCYYCLTQKANFFHLFLFALLATSVVLLRPLTIVFFIPFIFYLTRYVKWVISSAVLLVIYIAFVLFSPVQKKNWEDYFSSVQIHIKLHQNLMPILQNQNPVFISGVEGVDINSNINRQWVQDVKQDDERSNFFIFYGKHTGKELTIKVMNYLTIVCCILILLPLAFIRFKKMDVNVEILLLLGFVMYNTCEFLFPIVRYTYNFVQFIFPVLLLVKSFKKIYILPMLLIYYGIYCNIITDFSIFMLHTKGQFMIMAAMLLVAYRPILTHYFKERKFRLFEQIYWI
jgi:hypothetical protein